MIFSSKSVLSFGKFLLKPKAFVILVTVISLLFTGFKIKREIKAYGDAQYVAGKEACETAIKVKADSVKAQIDINSAASEAEAAQTQTIYVDIVREVAVRDAVLMAENDALRDSLQRLKMENDDAPFDDTLCARTAIPDDSLHIHTEIDRLLRSN